MQYTCLHQSLSSLTKLVPQLAGTPNHATDVNLNYNLQVQVATATFLQPFRSQLLISGSNDVYVNKINVHTIKI